MPAISKKQFVILAIIVILITIFIIISIVNGNNSSISNDINNINNASNNNPIPSQDINNSDIVIPNNNNEENNENKPEEDLTSEEVNINTQSQDIVLSQIQNRIEVVTNKNSQLIFKNMFSLTSAEVEKYIGVNVSMFDSYIVRMSQSKFSSEMYMIFKPFEDEKDNAKAQIKRFLLSYESSWEKLNSEQYDLVKNRTAVERNGYIIYIISIDNNTIMNEIRNYI